MRNRDAQPRETTHGQVRPLPALLRTPRRIQKGVRSSLMKMFTWTAMVTAVATLTASGARAQIERLTAEVPISFDSRGRVMIMTPRLSQSLERGASWWPVPADSWREARLFSVNVVDSDSTMRARIGKAYVAILAITQANGNVVRYGLSTADFDRLRAAFDGGAIAVGSGASPGAMSGIEISQPAGYTFVRNQTFLGLAAYGPATAASLSHSGGAGAAGGYFLAAGASFFVAAQMIRSRVVTRSQTILGTHAGFRGGLAGAAVAAIGQANDGPGFGVPILVGALGGTVGGFLSAKNMSDGEAAASGLVADMFALTALGAGTMANALEAPGETTKHKVALGAAVAMAAAGYVIGPQYARRAHYNVTSGDASVAFTTAIIGAAAGAALVDADHQKQTAAAFATAGLIGGFIASDRLLVSKYDRSSSDGGWVKLGAAAGALMGGGVAAISKTQSQGTLGLVATGAALGLIAADRMIAPSRDAGPMRGVLRGSSLGSGSRQERVQLMLPSAVTSLVLWTRRAGVVGGDMRMRGRIVNMPAVRVVF